MNDDRHQHENSPRYTHRESDREPSSRATGIQPSGHSPTTERQKLQRDRVLHYLCDLIRNLDIMVYCQLSILYYMECVESASILFIYAKALQLFHLQVWLTRSSPLVLLHPETRLRAPRSLEPATIHWDYLRHQCYLPSLASVRQSFRRRRGYQGLHARRAGDRFCGPV